MSIPYIIDGTGKPAGLHNSIDRSTPSTGRSQAIFADRSVTSHFCRPVGHKPFLQTGRSQAISADRSVTSHFCRPVGHKPFLQTGRSQAISADRPVYRFHHSVISTEKFSLVLHRVVLHYFTIEKNSFHVCIISGFSSLNGVKFIYLRTYFHGEISGLRSRTSSVVIGWHVSNVDTQHNYGP